ncbi:MAG: MBL fold metallo-hydrolase [Treponema sp.]|nr:MBL fold metallo-hydrolase [Treponema sp.]
MELVHQGNMVEVFKVSERFYFRRANLPLRWQCNGAYIVGDSSVAVVDAPPQGTAEILAEAERLFAKPVTALFLTHAHGDHFFGLPEYLETGAAGRLTVYCSRRVIDTLAPELRNSPLSFVGVDGSLTLCFSGGIDLELFCPQDPMHSKWDMFVHIKEPGLICAGDAVVEYQNAYFHNADIHAWILGVRRLAERNVKWVLPGHGPELFPPSYIADFAHHLSSLEMAAKECLERLRKPAGENEKSRPLDTGTAEIADLVEKYFAERGALAREIQERVGDKDARREVRMVLWEMLRELIR